MTKELTKRIGELTGMMVATFIPWLIIFHFLGVRP